MTSQHQVCVTGRATLSAMRVPASLFVTQWDLHIVVPCSDGTQSLLLLHLKVEGLGIWLVML